jgi:hypothetical protein
MKRAHPRGATAEADAVRAPPGRARPPTTPIHVCAADSAGLLDIQIIPIWAAQLTNAEEPLRVQIGGDTRLGISGLITLSKSCAPVRWFPSADRVPALWTAV